jgi:lipopolysaccharide/colanic/teichoic acid biosynthesis glycosyltransferase
MKKIKFIAIIVDVLALYLAIVLAVVLRGLVHVRAVQTTSEWISAHTNIFFPSVIFAILALYIAGLYDFKILYDKAKTLTLLLYAQLSIVIFSIFSFYILKTDLTPKLTLFFYIILSTAFLFFSRIIFQNIYSKAEKKIGYFISDNRDLIKKISEKEAPYDLINISWEKLTEKMNDIDVSNYIFNEEEMTPDRLQNIEKLKLSDKKVFSYTEYYEFLFKKVDLENFSYERLSKNLSEKKEKLGHKVFRRFIDITLGIVILPVFLLSIIFVYIAMLFESGFKNWNKIEIFSIQDRLGLLGKMVKIYKFRTMTSTDIGGIVEDGEKKNSHSKYGNTVTKLGEFLRKTRIDELPQCINFLKGDISLIGPRSSILGVHNDMMKHIKFFDLRLIVPQGLTGWAQVHMSTPPRTYKEHEERLAYELYYIRHRSIFLDVVIILKTIKTLISRTGA